MKSFQQIYDFCNGDPTYRAYYDAPDQLECSGRVYRYYHGYVNDRHTRCGSYIFQQSRAQLDRFLGGQRESYHIHFDRKSRRPVEDIWKHHSPEMVTYVTAYISSRGVRINYEHPYSRGFVREAVVFTARSHRTYDEQGVIEEVLAHIDKHLLLAPGRYRDLQLAYKIRKEDFVEFYREYKRKQELQSVIDEAFMRMKYSKRPRPMDYRLSEKILENAGFFSDLNIMSCQRHEFTMQFMEMFNSRL